jgi:two-component system response regulator FixJ
MKLGAIEFLEKPFEPGLLDGVLDRAFLALDDIMTTVRARERACELLDQLSPRELEVMALLVTGMGNKAVASQLGLSIRTVEMHRGAALARLKLKSIAEALSLVVAADRRPN